MKNYQPKRDQYHNSDTIYWRYQKHTPPQEEFPGRNGPVIIKKPAKTPKDYPAKAEFGYGKATQHLRDIMREG